jgi:undecaprenyl-diphosphatase
MDKKYSKKIVKLIVWLGVFTVFSLLVMCGVFKGVNTAVSGFIISSASPLADRVFLTGRSLGRFDVCLFLAIAISAYAFLKGDKRFAVVFLAAFFLLVNAEDAVKRVVRHERPVTFYSEKEHRWQSSIGKTYAKKSFSYPSGHSTRAFFVFAALAMAARRSALAKKRSELIRGLLYSLIIWVGFSSVYLGAHWPADIIGAFLLGYIILRVACLIAPCPLKSAQEAR